MATHYIAQLLLPFTLMVVVHCQTSYPQFEFGERVLTNNSYISIDEGEASLGCVTNYSDCCAESGAGSDVGNWFDRNGSEVHQGADEADLYVIRGEGVVYLNRITGGVSGMWRCDTPDSDGMMQSIYIYLGTSTTG